MAGDHKCPVCQATFTRPQHVARHMRSHTGDRPYKCQHCGDQFARSDLLSRHVNKCHAGDKPPTTTAPNRRKGQQSSTRATTSKQACDQCVMATLPCDGANPCSKCIQRKSPCTYVKFQRQTAPVGPGHRHTHSVESTSSTSSNFSIPRPDELFLGPPPMTVPSMAPSNDLYYPPQSQFAFNAPPGVPSWENSPNHPPSLTLSSSAADSGHDSSSSDVASRYRNAEMLRSTMMPPGYSGNPALLPNYYGNQQAPGPGDQWGASGTEYASRRDKDMQEGFAQYLPPGATSQLAGPGSLLHPSNFDFQGGGLYNLHTRRGSVDGYSDGGSAASGPNSAASSSAHLPLDFPQGEQQQHQAQQQPALAFSAYNQFDDNQRPPPSRDGRFASSFGLMSLADGDANYPGNFNNPDGSAPFFTQTAMKLPPQDSTPRPFRTEDELNQIVHATGTARDREAEMRELREFWKQYLRTPLSGPSLGQTPKAELINNQFGVFGDPRPTPKRGLSRVASLPSVRTPPEEKPSALQNGRYNQPQIPPTPGNARPVHTTDDLKSYEQAVLARKTPLNLSLAPKKGRMSNASSVSPSGSPAMSQQQPALGNPPRQHGTFIEPGTNNIPNAKTGALSSSDASTNEQGAQSTDVRPSFKRLPSQTLENTIQKRALFSWGNNEDVIDDSESDADGPPSGIPANRQVFESSPDRFRRLSAPTTSMRPGSSELSPISGQTRFSYASNMNGQHANGIPVGISGPGPGAHTDPMVRS